MKIITIGSSKGGVGKTTIAKFLAKVAKQDGKRVLLLNNTDDLVKNINCDLIIIDVNGNDNKLLKAAIATSDLLIIPVLADMFNIWATSEIIELFHEINTDKNIKARILLNKVQYGDNANILNAFEKNKIDILSMNTKIHFNSILSVGVIDVSADIDKVIDEFKELYREINLILDE